METRSRRYFLKQSLRILIGENRNKDDRKYKKTNEERKDRFDLSLCALDVVMRFVYCHIDYCACHKETETLIHK